MKTLISIVFVLLLSLITLHDAHSKEISITLKGFDKSIAAGMSETVIKVRTSDGELFTVKHLASTAKELKHRDVIDTEEGQALAPYEVQTFFYMGQKHGPVVKKHPEIGY